MIYYTKTMGDAREREKMFTSIKKRDGRVELFEAEKITRAIAKAGAATGEFGDKIAQKLTLKVLNLAQQAIPEGIPTVEEIQDMVEEVLLSSPYRKTAKAYIIYREQHAGIREITAKADVDLVDQYLEKLDWQVSENSNMSFSLQGLNYYVSSEISKIYWLRKIYPPEVRQAHTGGDFHIHDLNLLSVYCVGWDLFDLLVEGFKGAQGKIESKPAKHLRSALGQVVNFFYTLQGEAAGAQAFSNFDTLLAPFIRYDGLGYKEVKQALQEFVFNINVPTRVGFQCMSEDTEILGENGWKRYNQTKEGDIIATFNIEKGFIEYLPVRHVFAREYRGMMYNLKNRSSDQLISPEHRVVSKRFGAEGYTLEKIERVYDLKSPFMVPVGSEGKMQGNKWIDKDVVKLIAWVISEGGIDRSGGISIYQSKAKNRKNYDEILSLCNSLKLKYTERTQKGLGNCEVIRFDADTDSTRSILQYFKTNKNKFRGIKFIPDTIINADAETARLFLETYIKGEGHDGSKITTTSAVIKDGLMQVLANAGYGATVLTRKPDNALSKKDRYIIRIIRHKDIYINKVKRVNYSGVIWCPNTDNETVIARRKGKIFITGNTPFTNITLDLTVPKYYANEGVVIGGEIQKETYREFQPEMELFNRVFLEVMAEGDAKERVFTFPIPTYNITRDFDWGNPNLDVLWEVTAKYGVPYFSNFINSDMNPEDARSMCPIGGNEKVLIKSNLRGRGLEYSTIKYIYEGNAKGDVYEIYSDGKFVKGRFNKFPAQPMIKVTLENGHELKMTEEHLNFVMLSQKSGIEELKGIELREGMYLPFSLKAYEGSGGNKDMGYFVGAFAGDGSFDGETTVVFSLSAENEKKRELVRELIQIGEEYFGASCTTKSYEDNKLYTLKVHSRAAVGLCKDFVSGKERDKCYRARLFNTGKEFRKGVIEGHYATDGGNRNRIYTSSPKMVETLNMLAASLGTTTSVYIDNREGRFGPSPNYAVLIYQLNREKYGNIWFKHDNKLWVEIKSIEPITDNTAYCFEVESGEPMFTVGTTGILTHNCRLRIDNRELKKRGGGLFGSSPLTGSIGVVTLNMPRVGYLAKDEAQFISALERLMVLAKESLEVKRKVLEKFTEESLYPYTRYYLRGVKERFGEYWKNHFSTIGLVGMTEACLNMFGEPIASKKSREFTSRVLDFMRDKLLAFQAETGNNYNLEATPAEGTSYRLAKKDKEKYPGIVCANEEEWKEGAESFYTNSTQLPVNYTEDVFEALDLQDAIQTKYTGGTVFHVFAGERVADYNTLKELIRKICELYHLPYFTFTPTFSVCPVHGYIAGEHYTCPKCGAETEVYSRVVGYLRPVTQWNKGKREEFKLRKTFAVDFGGVDNKGD